jgi:hypothetical protein
MRKSFGYELVRGAFDVVVDGKRVGSIESRETIETPVESGLHTLQVRKGRRASRVQTFDAAEDEIVAFRCHGGRTWPIWLVSLVVPSLGISLRRE